ncbi:MAG: hypothetical protein VYC34_08510 [Planctomycetota bacterium]|nr:hypothetical protein [Planctomycetota bacterium]
MSKDKDHKKIEKIEKKDLEQVSGGAGKKLFTPSAGTPVRPSEDGGPRRPWEIDNPENPSA